MKISDRTFLRLPRLLKQLQSTSFQRPYFIGRPDIDYKTNKNFCWAGPGYIFSRALMAQFGPHLLHCHEIQADVDLQQGQLPEQQPLLEDLMMERCLEYFVPLFKGCQNFPNAT